MSQYSFPFEREAISAAKSGAVMPDGLDLCDQLAFQTLAQLYRRYFSKMVTKEVASLEKTKIRVAWEKRKVADASSMKLFQYHENIRLEIGNHARDFLKAKSVADALEAARKILETLDYYPVELSPEVLEDIKK